MKRILELNLNGNRQGRSKGRADGAAALKENNFRALIWLYWSFKFYQSTQSGALTDKYSQTWANGHLSTTTKNMGSRFFSAPRNRGAYFYARPEAHNWLATALVTGMVVNHSVLILTIKFFTTFFSLLF